MKKNTWISLHPLKSANSSAAPMFFCTQFCKKLYVPVHVIAFSQYCVFDIFSTDWAEFLALWSTEASENFRKISTKMGLAALHFQLFWNVYQFSFLVETRPFFGRGAYCIKFLRFCYQKNHEQYFFGAKLKHTQIQRRRHFYDFPTLFQSHPTIWSKFWTVGAYGAF